MKSITYEVKYSELCEEDVVIFKEKIESKVPYCDCTRCGKPIKKTMFVVQSRKSGVELMYLGSECIKYFR